MVIQIKKASSQTCFTSANPCNQERDLTGNGRAAWTQVFNALKDHYSLKIYLKVVLTVQQHPSGHTSPWLQTKKQERSSTQTPKTKAELSYTNTNGSRCPLKRNDSASSVYFLENEVNSLHGPLATEHVSVHTFKIWHMNSHSPTKPILEPDF